MNLGTAQVIHGNARHLPLADDSVDLVVTSPPYFALRSYQDAGVHYDGQIGSEPTPAEFVDALIEVTRECVRVLKPSGSLFVNIGDKYSTYEHRPTTDPGSHTWALASQRAQRYTRNAPAAYGVPYKSMMGIPWKYALACMAPQEPTDMISAPTVQALLDMADEGTASLDYVRDAIDELSTRANRPGMGLILRQELIWSKGSVAPTRLTDRARRTHEHVFHFTTREKYYSNMDALRVDGGGLPGSVLTIPPTSIPGHRAVFPPELARWMIEGWCPPNGTVLDPMGGSGTTAMVAKALGRHGITVDMSADYCRLAKWRTTDRNQLAKVLGIEKMAAPDPAQGTLWGGVA